MASTAPSPTHRPPPLSPTETYRLAPDTTSPVSLRIATGGAGQSGLIKALAEAFIAHHLRRRTAAAPPFFAVAWSASDTSQSFNALAHGGGGADVGITYHAEAERTALEQGVAERRAYAWRDHWMLVGPASDPAGLGSCDGGGVASVYALFKRLFRAAVATQEDAVPVRFLSRFDKSANNIKESAIWAAVGQTPWAVPYSGWYHQCVRMPFQALETAARLGEYTLTDKGTWIGVEEWVRDGMMVFVSLSSPNTNAHPPSSSFGRS
ncbi:hypothetical protein MBLNU459_g7895t2 [Dothideomycetes sp. NU459]